MIDSPDIFGGFVIVCNKPCLRSNRIINTFRSNKNYIIKGPYNRIANVANEFNSDIEFFGGSLPDFHSNIKNFSQTN